MNNRQSWIIGLTIAGISLFMVFIGGSLIDDLIDDVAEKDYILNSEPCGLTNYIDEGKKDQTRTFASFSFSYNNETGNYDQEKISFTISKDLVPLAELRYFEECKEKNESD